ncbi:MAG: ABC transporter substrate-binding protein [Ignavibacteriaceae bacterium]|nr:ABC transporter substrate-binding protein [Ignavibacteriaceae bacterium]
MKISLFLILVLFFSINAQTVNISEYEIEAEFQIAVSLYDSSQYNDALEFFNRIAFQYQKSTKTSAAELFIAKIFYNQKEFEASASRLNDFLRNFSNSSYKDEAQFTLANCYLNLKDYSRSISELLEIIENSNSKIYASKSKKLLETIYFKHLDLDRLKSRLPEVNNYKSRAALLLIQAKLQLYYEQHFESLQSLNSIVALYDNTDESNEAKKIIDLVSKSSDNGITTARSILVLQSTNSDYADVRKASQEALEGIKFASDEFNRNKNEKIGLLIRNIKGNETEIKQIADELKDRRFCAIIAPLHSKEVGFILKYFNHRGIPILSPTATEDSLTIKWENFFQANPSFVMRGKVMAQYIKYVEDKIRIAVVYSNDGYSKILSESFIEEFEAIGGEVIKKIPYSEKNANLTQILSPLKKLKLDGIYSPISHSSTAPILLSALLRNGINVQIYGNQDWMDARGIESFSQLSKKLTLTSDYFVDYQDFAYIDFVKKFSSLTRKEVNRNVIYGYDAASFLFGVLQNKLIFFNRYVEMMKSQEEQSGFHNSVSFDEHRINQFLNIVRFRNNIFELVDVFKYENRLTEDGN